MAVQETDGEKVGKWQERLDEFPNMHQEILTLTVIPEANSNCVTSHIRLCAGRANREHRKSLVGVVALPNDII